MNRPTASLSRIVRAARSANTAVLLVAVVVAGLLAGCSSGARTTGPSGTTASAPSSTTAGAATGSPTATTSTGVGRWTAMPAPPVPPLMLSTGVWDGTELLVVGEAQGSPTPTGYAAAFDPAKGTWRRLPTPTGARANVEGAPSAVWTGTEMIVWGGDFFDAYRPATDTWRRLQVPDFAPYGVRFAMVWTGTRLVMYGGGCCGGPNESGAALDPVTGTWTRLSTELLGGRWTSGAWTGREVVIAGGTGTRWIDPDHVGGEIPLADAAAYDPARNSWRRLNPLPVAEEATLVAAGSQVFALGPAGCFAWSASSQTWTAYSQGWDGRRSFGAVWTGDRLLVWGGVAPQAGSTGFSPPSHGLSWSRSTGTWTALPMSPLRGRSGAVLAWTGTQLLVWGGSGLTDGAVYTP
jgi:hypothetical protein